MNTMASEHNYLENRRVDLHYKLVNILGTDKVYFQPPETIKMSYPAIVYERYRINKINACNSLYAKGATYKVTVIDKNPCSIIVEKIIDSFPTAKHIRHTTYDNLNQDVFEIDY